MQYAGNTNAQLVVQLQWLRICAILNAKGIYELALKFGGLESEMEEIVMFLSDTSEAGGQGQPAQPTSTTRTNVRVNRPGATRQGKDDAMGRILMGAGVQDGEAAALSRGVG